MKKLLSFLPILFSISVFGQFNGPESIDFHAPSNRYFISNTQTGSIKYRNPDGSIGTLISNLTPAPYGIEIIGDTLYACCASFLRGYDINTGQQVISINTGATFLNGITHDNNGNIYVTDYTGKRIHRVRYLENTSNIMISGLTANPNGIIYDQVHNRCVYVNWGSNAKIMQLNLSDSTVSVLQQTSYTNIDGIARDNNDNYYIAVWGNNSIVRYAANFSTSAEIVATGMNKPADIYYNLNTDTLAVPNSGNNTISLLNFAPPPPPSNTICSLLPVTVNTDSIVFKTIGMSSFGDSAIHVTLYNASEYNFAYPLARYEFLSPLPAGVTVHPNSQGFNVFASAWNTLEPAVSTCNMFVTQPIPDNYTVKFRLWLANLSPAPADTCYFTDTFSVVLKFPLFNGQPALDDEALTLLAQHGTSYTIQASRDITLLKVVDITGRIICSITPQNQLATIDLSNDPPGIYLVQRFIGQSPRGIPLKLTR